MNENNMTRSNEQRYEEKSPVIKIEQSGVSITVTFAESAEENNTKETILDLLTNAYEKRIRQTE